MEFSPRLKQILLLLVNADYPISAAALAEQLQISKRTVFRELEHVDRQLEQLALKLETKSKKGIYLTGSDQGRACLKEKLDDMDSLAPWNKEDRLRKLILQLMEAEEPRKIYYFSQVMEVSEGTVNRDLEAAEKWFQENQMKLIRKPGLGIYLNYEEAVWRRAFMRYIYQNMEQPFQILHQLIGADIVSAVRHLIQAQQDDKITGMTEYSYTECIIYISVMIYRIMKGKHLEISGAERVKSDPLSDHLADTLERTFGIKVDETERNSLCIYMEGAKLQHTGMEESAEGYFDLQCLIYEMIHQYDQTLAWQMKNEDTFVKGLLAHLRPTIMRLQNNIVIHNPFQKEVEDLYPDVYAKTKKAVSVLEHSLSVEVPEEETGLLALHFGGAQVRIRNREKILRKVQIGVVCASGIGMSTLLSSRIIQLFGDKAEVYSLAVSDIGKDKMQNIEICISTFDLSDITRDYIKIHPMLSEEDITRISERIEAVYDRPARQPAEYNMLGRMEELTLITEEITSIVRHFNIHNMAAGSTFHEVVRMAARKMGGTEADQHIIYKDIVQREALSTQVIPEYGFALLHAKTKGVSNSKFAVILPEGRLFTDPHFQQVEAVMVMLIIEEDQRDQPAMSAISTCLFEDESFLQMLKDGEETGSRHQIERILNQYFFQHIKNA